VIVQDVGEDRGTPNLAAATMSRGSSDDARARDSPGHNYAGFSDTHQAQLDAIYDRLESIGTAPRSDARPVVPWIPANASRFLRFAEDIEPSDREGLAKDSRRTRERRSTAAVLRKLETPRGPATRRIFASVSGGNVAVTRSIGELIAGSYWMSYSSAGGRSDRPQAR